MLNLSRNDEEESNNKNESAFSSLGFLSKKFGNTGYN